MSELPRGPGRPTRGAFTDGWVPDVMMMAGSAGARSAVRLAPNSDAVIVFLGADTLSKTGKLFHRELGDLEIPVILTGTDAAIRIGGESRFQVVHNFDSLLVDDRIVTATLSRSLPRSFRRC